MVRAALSGPRTGDGYHVAFILALRRDTAVFYVPSLLISVPVPRAGLEKAPVISYRPQVVRGHVLARARLYRRYGHRFSQGATVEVLRRLEARKALIEAMVRTVSLPEVVAACERTALRLEEETTRPAAPETAAHSTPRSARARPVTGSSMGRGVQQPRFKPFLASRLMRAGRLEHARSSPKTLSLISEDLIVAPEPLILSGQFPRKPHRRPMDRSCLRPTNAIQVPAHRMLLRSRSAPRRRACASPTRLRPSSPERRSPVTSHWAPDPSTNR